MSEGRVAPILARLREIAAGIEGEPLAVSGAGDELDALAEGMNMLAEEIAHARTMADARFALARDELVVAQRRAKVGTWDFDLKTREGSWSPYMYELFDRDPELGVPPYHEFLELLHPDDRPTLAAEQQRAVAGEPPRSFELRTNPRSATARVLSCVIESVTLSEGGAYLRGTNLDVTVHRKISSELREAHDRLTQLLDSAPYTVLTVSTDLTISYINRRPPGWPADTLGASLPALLHADDRPRLEAHLGDVFASGTAFTVELRDVEGTWLEARGTALRLHGEVQSALVFVVDVTERRRAAEARTRLEERMQHAQKLESLGVLAGGIAHDFNNLLMGVLGNAELARASVPAGSSAGECLEDIVTASHRAADLCRQMLAYSGKGRFVIEAIDVAALVRDMAHLLEASKSKRAALRFDFEPDLPAFEGDVNQIRQVVMNLITNASDAVEDAGVITISAGVQDCDATYLGGSYLDDELEPGRYVWLEVTDTGCGMDATTQRRMFEPFFTSKDMGRGLGLAAVLGIVRGHGGALRVYSELGKGSTVKCLFPASDKAAVPRPTPPPKSISRTRAGTVLVVDDEEVVRKVAKSTLEQAGFDVVLAADGAEGVACFRDVHERLALVLLDVTMPNMDGKTALREMRRIDPAVKVILMSGYNEQAVTQDYVGRGLAGFAQKPFAPVTLLELVDRILDQ